MRLVFHELVEDRRPGLTADGATEAARLRQLARQIHADAVEHEATTYRLRTEATEGRGAHVAELLERRSELGRRVRAIRELDDAELGHTQLTRERADRLDRIAGPEPGRTSTLLEYRALDDRWDSLRASAQALDELAAERPADLARRQHARADRITRRATAQLEGAPPSGATESAVERLRAARRAAGHAPSRDHAAVNLASVRSVDISTADSTAYVPTLEPPESLAMRHAVDEAPYPLVEPVPNDGIDAGV